MKKTHCSFFLGWVEDKMVICCLNWDKLCRSKAKGSLGVKNCERFNLTLFNRWKWRIINKIKIVWYNFFSLRYGDIKDKILDAFGVANIRNDYRWWRNLRHLGGSRMDDQNLFADCILGRLSNGISIDFWKYRWLYSEPMRSLFLWVHFSIRCFVWCQNYYTVVFLYIGRYYLSHDLHLSIRKHKSIL